MSENQKNNDFNFEEILNIIKDGFTKTIEDNYSHYKEYTVYISSEQQFIRDSNKNTKGIYIVVKYGTSTVNYGQTILPVTMTAISEQNKLDVCHDLLLDFVKTNNLISYEDGKIQQIYNTPVIFSNFHEMYAGYRSLASVKGVFLISYAANYYYVKTYNPDSLDIEKIQKAEGTSVKLILSDDSLKADTWYLSNDEEIQNYIKQNNLKPVLVSAFSSSGKHEFKKVPYAKWYLSETVNDEDPVPVSVDEMQRIYGITVNMVDNISEGSISFDVNNSLTYDSTSYLDNSGQTEEMSLGSDFFQNVSLPGTYMLSGRDFSTAITVKQGNVTLVPSLDLYYSMLLGNIEFIEEYLFTNASFDVGLEAGEWSIEYTSSNVSNATITSNSKLTSKLAPTVGGQEFSIKRKNYYQVYIDGAEASSFLRSVGDIEFSEFNGLKLRKTNTMQTGSYSFSVYLDKLAVPGEGIDVINDFNVTSFETFITDIIEDPQEYMIDSNILSTPSIYILQKIGTGSWKLFLNDYDHYVCDFNPGSNFSTATGIYYTDFYGGNPTYDDVLEIKVYYRYLIDDSTDVATNISVIVVPSNLNNLELNHTYQIQIPTVQIWTYTTNVTTSTISDVGNLSDLETKYGISLTVSDNDDITVNLKVSAQAVFLNQENISSVGLVANYNLDGLPILDGNLFHIQKTWTGSWALSMRDDLYEQETNIADGADLLERYDISFVNSGNFSFNPISCSFRLENTMIISNEETTETVISYNINNSTLKKIGVNRTYIFNRAILYNYYVDGELQEEDTFGFPVKYGIKLEGDNPEIEQSAIVKLDFEELEEVPCMNASFDFSVQLDSQPYAQSNNIIESVGKFASLSITFSTFLLTSIDLVNRVLDVVCTDLDNEPEGVNTTYYLSVTFKNGKKIIGKFKLVHCAATESIINSDLPVIALTFSK